MKDKCIEESRAELMALLLSLRQIQETIYDECGEGATTRNSLIWSCITGYAYLIADKMTNIMVLHPEITIPVHQPGFIAKMIEEKVTIVEALPEHPNDNYCDLHDHMIGPPLIKAINDLEQDIDKIGRDS